MKKIKHTGKILDNINGSHVIECVVCGFKHIYPLPSKKEVAKLYKQEFYSKDKPNYFKYTKEDYSWWQETYNNYYSLFEKYTKGRSILDIGSGPGDFLICGKKRGWKILGIEPSIKAWRYSKSRNIEVINNFFTYEKMKLRKPFNVVHASFVLEHVSNPISFIVDIKKLLKPGGLVAICCPNDFNPLQKILQNKLKYKSWWISPKHHINYFDPISMKRILINNGFEILECLGSFPMELFLLNERNYVENEKVGKKCHNEIIKFEMNMYNNAPEILNNIYSTLINKGIGRSFFIIARRKR